MSICHGDFGPWNLVWRDGLPVAVIDFDNAYAGDPADDVGYALRFFVELRVRPRGRRRSSCGAPRSRSPRTARDFDVPALLDAEYDRARARQCIAHGWHRQLAQLPRRARMARGERRAVF